MLHPGSDDAHTPLVSHTHKVRRAKTAKCRARRPGICQTEAGSRGRETLADQRGLSSDSHFGKAKWRPTLHHAAHATHWIAAAHGHGGCWLGLVGHEYFGGEQQAGDRRCVL